TTILDNSKDTPNDPYDQTTTPPVEGNLDTITIKLFALDKDGNRVPANEVAEGSPASYVAVAFDKNGVELTLNETVEVTFGKTGDSATAGGVDYDSTTQTVTLGKPFSTNTVDDYLADNGEKYSVQITDKTLSNATKYETVVIDTTSVTTTILDNSKDTPNDPYDQTTTPPVEGNLDTITIKLFALDKDGNRVPANEVAEGSPASYVAVAFDKNGVELTLNETVEVTFGKTGDSATAGGVDYDSTTQTVTLGKPFSTNTVDDYLADNGEKYSVQITDKTLSNATKYETVVIDTTSVTTTILDNKATKNHEVDDQGGADGTVYGKEDTVYAQIIANKNSVVEGGEVTYTVKLVDAAGKEVKVTSNTQVTVTFNTNNSVADNEVELKGTPNNPLENGETIIITIPSGSSSSSFTIKTKDDFKADNNETFKLKITDIGNDEFENLVYNHTKGEVTTTIKDGVTLGTPTNAYVDEDKFYVNDLDGTNGGSTDKTNISDKQSLGIKNPNGDNAYTLSFASKNGIPDIEVFKGNVDSKDGLNQLTSDGKIIQYKFADNNNKSIIIGYVKKDGGGTEDVFKITLNKNSSLVSGLNPDKVTQDSYTYTQYKNIDHPVAGDATDPINDDNITFEFGFTISDHGSTSEVQTFKVTVNDSVPLADDHELIVYEDNSLQFVLSDGAFKDGKIKIDNNDGNGFKEYSTNATVKIYEGSKEVGTIKILEGGKLEFKPVEDYSKYDASDKNKLPNFKYQVSDTDGDYAEGTIKIQVKPVADAPTIKVNDVTSYEDASTYSDLTTGNKAEGGNKIPLGLLVPSLSTDQKDKNNATGDSPERNGEITLNFTAFTNGQNIKDAELYNGNKKVADIENGTEIKIVIVDNTGQVDKNYHHDNVTLGQANTLYLTESEYESLKIQHAEDNDTDIKITIKVTSYEVDDNGKPLFKNDDYADNNNSNLKKDSSANMIVVIKPVTDNIELKFDTNTVNGEILGTISPDGKTFVFKNDVIKENGEINFKQLLTNTSGTTDGTNGTEKGDLDGSEIRWYTVKFEGDSKDHPDYLIINGKTVSLSNGEYKYEFTTNENKQADPDFKVQFPNGYSGGTLKGELTLHVQDRGVEEKSDPTKWGDELKQTVKFEVAVNPVADDATIKVGQPEGFEDAGRTSLDKDGKYDKNIQDKDGTIKHPENGIKLPIEVTSTDKDGSETFTVTIKDIPNGSGLYVYDKSSKNYKLVEVSNDGTKITIDGVDANKSGNISVTLQQDGKFAVEIEDYQNSLKDGDGKYIIEEPKFIPPHNAHGDFDLKIDAKTVDTVDIDGQPVISENTTAKDKVITVVVKDVADSVVGNEYKIEDLSTDTNYKKPDERQYSTFNKVVDEADAETNGISLNSIFTYSTKLSSYDKESEDLTIILKSLPKGVELEGNVTLINGQYIFKASDISSIKIVTPANYSGELNFDITYITTEKGEANNPSKTHDSKQETDKISIFVKPTIDAQFDSQTTKEEDIQAEKVDGGNSYYKVDLGISHQNGDNDETLESVTIKAPEANSGYKLFIIDGNTKTEITSDYTLKYTDKDTELNKVYVEVKENQHGSFDIKGTYTVKDSQYAGKDVNYETKETKDFTHKLTISPVTDKPTITVEDSVQTKIEVISGEAKTIDIPIKVTSADKDGSESITKIVISGIPKGVTISFGDAETDPKVTVSEHNGIYTIVPKDGNYKLNDANFKNIVFKVDGNANFEYRDITITAYTKDAQGSIEEQTSTKITLDKTHNGNGGGTGTGPKLDIIVDEIKKDFNATEDTQFNFLDVFKVTVADNSNDGRTELNFKIDVGSNATLKGLDAYKNADGSYTIKGNRADIESVLANLKVVPNKDFNSNQDADGISIKVETNGKESTIKVPVTPVTDSLNVEITANDSTTIDENGEFNFDIKLTNNSDKEFTNINDFYVVVNENFEAGESSKGKLYLGNTKLELVDGKYKLPADYKLGDSLNLTYKSGEDRHGAVEIKVIALNKETGATNELTSTGTTTITVKPVASSEIEVKKVQDGIEDQEMASAKLNVVKVDPSEKFESVLIKVASGVAVYYDNGNALAMNLGDGSWLVPVNSDGTLPQIFFKGNEHFGGEIKFDAIINVKDGNSKSTIELKDSSVYIKEVADGVTIDPTKTGIDKNAFEWTSLNLNANMKDLDGSEKMHFTLEGLDSSAQFRIVDKDGNITDLSSQSKFENGKWTINGIEAKDINSIEISHDKSVSGVKVEASTVDGDNVSTSPSVSGTFDLSYKADAKFSNGSFTLAKDMDIDFNNIGKLGFTNVEKIDLGAGNGKNELLNLTLDDVLSIGKKDGNGNINLTILGDGQDKVSFKDEIGKTWEKQANSVIENNKTFDVYTNSDSTVQVKVEQPISDGITN
uniref:hypothetical protein n=1 Tax=Aliarcobacter butzleri TaxID=28197 RepID=UPI001868DA11